MKSTAAAFESGNALLLVNDRLWEDVSGMRRYANRHHVRRGMLIPRMSVWCHRLHDPNDYGAMGRTRGHPIGFCGVAERSIGPWS